MNNLSYRQIVAIGIAAVVGLPVCVGLVVGHFLDFWFGVVAGVLVLLFLMWLAQRHVKRMGKRERDNGQGKGE